MSQIVTPYIKKKKDKYMRIYGEDENMNHYQLKHYKYTSIV